ncbi:MAG: ABC transporter ATP-binding protein [Oscillospiraceae bacterium]
MARNKFDVDETLETPFSLHHLKKAGVYIKRHLKPMIISLIVSIISGIIALIGPLCLEEALNVAVPQKDFKKLILLSGGFLLTIIFSILFVTIRGRYMTKVGQEIIYDIRKDLFEHLQRLPFQYYDDRPHGKILTRVINYVNNVSDMLSNGIISFILEIFNIILIAIFMLFVNAKLSLVIFAGVPFFILITFLIKPAQRRSWQDVSNKGSNINAYLHESLDGAKVTQGFTREEENEQIYDKLNSAYRKSWMKAQWTSNLVWFSVDNISVIVIGVLYLVGFFMIGGGIGIGTLIAMATYAHRFWQPILSLSNIYNNFINTIAYLERIFETLDEEVTVDDKENAQILPPIKGNVEFNDVTFSYDGKINILENLSFDVKSGQSVALVGPTGAGKSTVVNLISRFYNLNGGKVLIDKTDISSVTLHSLRSQMGIMLQDSFIFSGTILENIKYGKQDATEEEVINACKTVCAHDFIMEFPDGYNTQVNERGSRLSQGQKQLIAFARTLLCNPKILVLDEATSSIDAKTEKLLQQGLNALLKGRTSFIIAHRLSTIKNCDKILYVSNKGIAESGNHDELMALGGAYYKLYTAHMAV